jgi:hypothetical protein
VSYAENDSMNQVYLCYSHDDDKIAGDVCEALKDHDIICWNDIDDEMARYYHLAVPGAVDYIQAVVLIFSANASNSDIVRREIELAFENSIPIIVFDADGSSLVGELEFFLSRAPRIDATSNIHHAAGLLADDLNRMSVNLDSPAVFKPDITIEGMVKPKASFSDKSMNIKSSKYVYLSYDDADLEFIASQIQQLKVMGVNFKHQIDSKISGSSLLAAFISKNSYKSSKIKSDITEAISNDVGIMLIHLDDSKPDFGRMFNLKYGSKLKKAIKYSIHKQDMDELAYIDKCDEIFQLFGVKK